MVKTPFRVSIVGGGTDLPAFYEKSGYGAVISMAIAKYMYVMIHPYFHDKLRIKYSQTEDVDSITQLKHPIVRECLNLMKITSGVEIASIADIPAGLGLGSSSSFTVCLLHALHTYRKEHVSKSELAQQACHIEIDVLQEPIGKQDQYAASYGGLNYIQFNSDGSTQVESLAIKQESIHEIQKRLMLFYIGKPRSASAILEVQKKGIRTGASFEAGCQLVTLTEELKKSMLEGKYENIGMILNEGWMLKKQLSSNITNQEIDHVYEKAMNAGAKGGKLLGAGAGGFMLFYCEPDAQPSLRKALSLRELEFKLDREGSKVIYSE